MSFAGWPNTPAGQARRTRWFTQHTYDVPQGDPDPTLVAFWTRGRVYFGDTWFNFRLDWLDDDTFYRYFADETTGYLRLWRTRSQRQRRLRYLEARAGEVGAVVILARTLAAVILQDFVRERRLRRHGHRQR